MNENYIKKLIRLVEESEIESLEVSSWGRKIRITQKLHGRTNGHSESAPVIQSVMAAPSPIMVAAPAPAADLTGLAPLDARFEGRIALLGWRAAQTGDAALTVRFCWAATRRIPTDLTAFVHLIDRAGEIVSQYDAQPGGAENPTSRWVPGESACSEHPLTRPAGTTPCSIRPATRRYACTSTES